MAVTLSVRERCTEIQIVPGRLSRLHELSGVVLHFQLAIWASQALLEPILNAIRVVAVEAR